jgi:enediyne biosynthesis protein E7
MTDTRVATQTARSGRLTAPGPRGVKLARSLLDVWRDRLGMMSGFTEEYGDVVRFKMGPKTLYFFNHPDHAKHVLADNAANYHKGIGLIHAKRVLGEGLLTSEDDLWRSQRRTIQPLFKRERVASYTGAIVEEASALLAKLDAKVGQGPVNLTEEMTGLTLGVLGKTLLEADLSPYELIGPAFSVAEDQAMFEMVTLNGVPPWLPIPRNRRFRNAQRAMEDVVFELVAQRGKDGNRGEDMVSRLVASIEGETDPRVRRRRLRDELVTILLAGHETTASTISWTWYLVSTHPEIWERLHAEAVEVLGDRAPEYEDLHALRYTNMVIQEATRLYPPVWILPRRAVGYDNIDGYRITPGADVLICPYTLHRHREFWPEPERFDPDRFDQVQSGQRHRYAYIPFGAGPRFCVGNSLGLLEATLVVAMMARSFRLATVPGNEVVAEPMLSLRVRGGLQMTVRRA